MSLFGDPPDPALPRDRLERDPGYRPAPRLPADELAARGLSEPPSVDLPEETSHG